MRSRRTVAFVLSVLTVSVALEGASYVSRAYECRFMMLPQAERAPCCLLSSKTRFTPEGGDCCHYLNLDEAVPGAMVSATPPVAQAMATPLVHLAEVPPALAVEVPVRRRARAPPPRWRPTDTTVLLI